MKKDNTTIGYKNHEGYSDPTPHKALSKKEWDAADAIRMEKALKLAKFILSDAGFDVVERIVLRNQRTGRIYR